MTAPGSRFDWPPPSAAKVAWLLLPLLLAPTPQPVVADPTPPQYSDGPRQLQECINSASRPNSIFSWQQYSKLQGPGNGANASVVRVAGLWWSPRPPSGSPLTLAVQLPYDRLTELLTQCSIWPGPISAVVYVAIPVYNSTEVAAADQKLSEAVTALGALHRRVQGTSMGWGAAQGMGNVTLDCQLDLMLAYELINDARLANHYPAALLRNYARLQVRTPLFAPLEPDMLAGPALERAMRETMAKPEAPQHPQQSQQPTAWVLPAFVTKLPDPLTPGATLPTADKRDTLAPRLAAGDKRALLQALADGAAAPYARGVSATHAAAWVGAAAPLALESRTALAEASRYGPWLALARDAAPWQDARLRGPGPARALYALQVMMSGHRLAMHPGAFLVHRWHAPSAARVVAQGPGFDEKQLSVRLTGISLFDYTLTATRRQMEELYRGPAQEGQGGGRTGWVEVLDPGTRACLVKLPWWAA